MNDFIGTKEEEAKEEVDSSAQKISVGGEDYSQEELDRLVGLGKIGLEAEEKYNTRLDKVWPGFTKGQQDLKEAKQELLELRNKPAPTPAAPAAELSIEDEITQAKALDAAKKLGILTKEDLEAAGYVSKEDLSTHVQEVLAGQKLAEKTLGLEKEIDGSDGRPAFVANDVLSYMEEKGYGNLDPEVAYEMLHRDALDTWKVDKATQLKKSKSAGFGTIDESAAGGAKEPEPLKVTHDNFDEMVKRGMKGEFTQAE